MKTFACKFNLIFDLAIINMRTKKKYATVIDIFLFNSPLFRHSMGNCSNYPIFFIQCLYTDPIKTFSKYYCTNLLYINSHEKLIIMYNFPALFKLHNNLPSIFSCAYFYIPASSYIRVAAGNGVNENELPYILRFI